MQAAAFEFLIIGGGSTDANLGLPPAEFVLSRACAEGSLDCALSMTVCVRTPSRACAIARCYLAADVLAAVCVTQVYVNTCAADSCVVADAYPSQFASQYHISLAPGDDTVTIDLSAEYLGACTLGTASPGTPFACNLYVLAAFDNTGCPTSKTMCVSRPVKVSPGASLCAWVTLGSHCLIVTCPSVTPSPGALLNRVRACPVVVARVPPWLLLR